MAILGLVWLREQILHGGGPAWLEPEARGGAGAAAAGKNISFFADCYAEQSS